MNLDELPAIVKRLQDSDARHKMLETAVMEQGAAIAEILELLRTQGPTMAQEIGKALAGLSLKMPEIRMPEIRFPEAKVSDSGWTSLSVAVKQPMGPDRVMTITKSK